jgi:uncharacterized RDD family membrane protein YckC
MARPGGVVTPEAVRLEFEAAGVGSRSLALLLDLLLQSLSIIVITIAGTLAISAAGDGLPDWVAITLGLLLVFAIFWGYPVAFETLWRGRTPGKAALGLRVVTREGAPVRFRHAAIRAAFALIDFYLAAGLPAVVSALVTREHQRIGDLVAGTLVLRERTGAPAPKSVTFAVPAGAEAYAATLDPSGLAPHDYSALRGFLLRAPEFATEVRTTLARDLADRLAGKVRHRRPAEVPPETFLICLAARYQQRGTAPAGATAATASPPEPRLPPPPAPAPSSTGGFVPPA